MEPHAAPPVDQPDRGRRGRLARSGEHGDRAGHALDHGRRRRREPHDELLVGHRRPGEVGDLDAQQLRADGVRAGRAQVVLPGHRAEPDLERRRRGGRRRARGTRRDGGTGGLRRGADADTEDRPTAEDRHDPERHAAGPGDRCDRSDRRDRSDPDGCSTSTTGRAGAPPGRRERGRERQRTGDQGGDRGSDRGEVASRDGHRPNGPTSGLYAWPPPATPPGSMPGSRPGP